MADATLDATVGLDQTLSDEEDEIKTDSGPRLVSLNSKIDNVSFPSSQPSQEVVLGRHASLSPACRFTDARISSRHCRIVVEEDGTCVCHDMSSNGTWVNQKKIGKGKQEEVKNGDIIALISAKSKKGPTPPEEMVSFVFKAAPTSGGAGKAQQAQDGSSLGEGSSGAAKTDVLEENMTCGICQEILYKCVSLIPCLHNFCAACISDWLKKNNTCPWCRDPATEVRRNHALMNLCETYLEAHPDRKRPAEELEDMNARTTIKDETLRLKRRRREYDYSDEEDEGSEEESEEEPERCRNCLSAAPDGFRCPDPPHHIHCMMCLQPMPDRPDQAIPQRCALCRSVFCDLYWGCRAHGGIGVLKPLKDHTISNMLPTACGGNTVESGIMRDYLARKGKSLTDVFQEMIVKIEAGEYSTLSMSGVPVHSDSTSCRACAERVFADLAYRYRMDIPESDLPDEVVRRPKCWYGTNCRTQRHNVDHAKRYNHAGPQTRH